MIDKFIFYSSYIRGLSHHTVDRYTLTLDKFNLFLNKIWKDLDKPEEITINDIYDYLGFIKKKGLLPSSCNSILQAIRAYFKYLHNIQELHVLDHRRIISCKMPEKNLGFFNELDKVKILNAVKEWIGVKETTQIKNKLLTYMLLHTGLRVHELAKIKVSELSESLQVVGKGGVLRYVYLRKELLDMIKLYLSKRKKKSEYLFPAHSWEDHMKTWSIQNVYKKLSKQLGIHIHPHKFRHTFATDLLHLPWANIYNVAKLMGHKRITTTQIYLWVNDWELKKLQFWLKF